MDFCLIINIIHIIIIIIFLIITKPQGEFPPALSLGGEVGPSAQVTDKSWCREEFIF